MRVMVIGASTDPCKYGNRSVRAYLRRGHDVVPVNPKAGAIEGLACYRSVLEAPGPIDRATIYLKPEQGFDVVTALAARGDVGELWLNPGSESDQLIDHAVRLGFDPIRGCSIVDIGERPE